MVACTHTVSCLQVLHSPFGGIIESENCIRAHLAGAEAAGATLELNTRVASWGHEPGRVRLHTEGGQTIEAKSAVFAAGAWMPNLIPELRGYLQPERQVVAWFEVRPPQSVPPVHAPVLGLELTCCHVLSVQLELSCSSGRARICARLTRAIAS